MGQLLTQKISTPQLCTFRVNQRFGKASLTCGSSWGDGRLRRRVRSRIISAGRGPLEPRQTEKKCVEGPLEEGFMWRLSPMEGCVILVLRTPLNVCAHVHSAKGVAKSTLRSSLSKAWIKEGKLVPGSLSVRSILVKHMTSTFRANGHAPGRPYSFVRFAIHVTTWVGGAAYARIITLNLNTQGGKCSKVLWDGTVYDENETSPDTVAIRKINEKIRTDDRVQACMLTIGDGLTLAMKK
ncbi:hypothetical protein HPB48_014262 [Haemaphysalis longicornis]|uniref:Uncharacterized protein n=1 Tax=Haemaphysalis longicornis TaxID=44386 RepID=A0A9J6FLR3_HAELO|nr:hypothetical protein HPB48_014262 [Haemaphysalis longicornis]